MRPIFDEFLAGIRNNLNDGIAEDDAIGMLSQHLITKPVFDALFEDYAFAEHNPVSQAMQGMIDSLQERGLEKETEGLENFYRDVRIRARGVATAEGKQQIIAELYERFLKLALPDTAANLGIVYTPTPVVDYIVRSVEDVLRQEFDGASLSDEGVHVLDPFVGTGTFITRLMRSGIIKPHDLARKYASELHANELQLLAYYIAAINIESTYHDLAAATEYQPFDGIVLTDTFQSYEPDDPMDAVLFPGNNQRIERQKGLDIRVIIGNPPYSATNNRAYPGIDGQVQETYAKPSATKHLSALYDPYVKAIRLASDRVQAGAKGGIVAFVTNGGFVESNAFDGFRKAVADEFDAVYCYNLRGDQRTSGELSRKEAGKIFGSGSRAGVAILLLIKKSAPPPPENQGPKSTIATSETIWIGTPNLAFWPIHLWPLRTGKPLRLTPLAIGLGSAAKHSRHCGHSVRGRVFPTNPRFSTCRPWVSKPIATPGVTTHRRIGCERISKTLSIFTTIKSRGLDRRNQRVRLQSERNKPKRL